MSFPQLVNTAYLNLGIPHPDLPLQVLHEGDEPYSLRGGGGIHRVVLQFRAAARDGDVELLHVLGQEGAESRKDLPVPRVVLQIDLRLDLQGQGAG